MPEVNPLVSVATGWLLLWEGVSGPRCSFAWVKYKMLETFSIPLGEKYSLEMDAASVDPGNVSGVQVLGKIISTMAWSLSLGGLIVGNNI